MDCKFCGDAIDGACSEIAVTIDGEAIAIGHLCPTCKIAAIRAGCFDVGALAGKADSDLWCDFCLPCPYEDGCEMPSVFNCPSIRKAIAEERE